KTHAGPRVRIGILRFQAAGNRIEFRVGLLRGHSWLQPRPDGKIVSVPELARIFVRHQRMGRYAPWRGQPQFTVLVRRKVRRHHSDNGILLPVKLDVAAHDRTIGSKGAVPKAIAEYHDVIIPRLCIARLQTATEDRTHSV